MADLTNQGVSDSSSAPSPSEITDDDLYISSGTSSSILSGEEDSIGSVGSQALFLTFDFSSPNLDIPLNIYSQQLATARLEFTKEDRANDVDNPRNTKAYYQEVAERCKLTRKQRKRLKNYFESWQALVDKINQEVAEFNPKITTYNSQVAADNAAIDALNAAIQQYNIDGIEANLTAAVNAYNAHFATANTGIATYDEAATEFNELVAENNEEIAELNAKAAKFVPPPPMIPLQTSATLAGQVAAYPPPPYTPPLATLLARPTFAPQATYADAPDPSLYLDPTIAGDQTFSIKSIIETRQLLDNQDKNLEFITFNLRGVRPNSPNAYVNEEPQPQSGGAASSLTGLGATMFGDKSPSLEGQLSLRTMLAALSNYDRGPVRDPSVQFSNEQGKLELDFKQDVAKAAISLLFNTAKQAGVAAAVRFDGELRNLRPNSGVADILIAGELIKIANNFKTADGEAILKGLAEELINGSDLLQGVAAEDKLAAIENVKVLLQNIIAQFSLQSLAIALKAPGLIAQVLGLAAPQFARALQPPTETDNLNAFLVAGGVQLQQFKNALIDSLILTGEVQQQQRRTAIQTVDAAVNLVAGLGPFQSLSDFFKTLKTVLTTGRPPVDTQQPSTPPVDTQQQNIPRVDTQPQIVEEAPPVVKPLPTISDTGLKEALDRAAVFLNNQLPLSTTRGTDLDRPIPFGLVDKDSYADSAAARRILDQTSVDQATFKQVLNNAISKVSLNTARELRDAVILESLRSDIVLDQAVLIGNRFAQEIVSARIAQNSFAVSRLDAQVLQDSIKAAILQQGILDQQQASAAAEQVTRSVAETNQRLTSENDLRRFIRDALVAKAQLSIEKAATVSINADFTVPKTDEQVLTGIGAERVLPPPRLAEAVNDLLAKELSTALPPERSREVAANIVLHLLGRPETRNLDELAQLSNTGSIVRITQDTLKHLETVENIDVSVQLEKEFRERMTLNVDVYSLSREIMDPANIYLKSKIYGISYTRDEPGFRKSIDIII